jgi:hypothetical protein
MVADNLHNAELGPWADTDSVNLRSTAIAKAGIGADAGLPDEVRFLSGVTRLIRRRRAENSSKSDPLLPAVFLLIPAANFHEGVSSAGRVPMLDNGLTQVVGRVWFVGPVPVSGRYVDLTAKTDDEIFRHVEVVLKFGTSPAVIFDPRTTIPQVRYYPKGISTLDDYISINIYQSAISIDRILSVVDDIYSKCLVTPEAQLKAGKLWQDNSKHWPVQQAEDVVQLYLKIGLSGAFPMCTIRHEQTAVPGRTDLEIEEQDPLDQSKFTRHAILELKVLRSYGSTGKSVSDEETLAWVKSGVKQAAAYRSDKGALASALCCFDMRVVFTAEKCFEHVAGLAKELGVVMRLWYIYASSKQYRDAHTARN